MTKNLPDFMMLPSTQPELQMECLSADLLLIALLRKKGWDGWMT
ncbi:MAG: hypothetical protein R6W68_00875 [Ignavibacteriaceae bacterium]